MRLKGLLVKYKKYGTLSIYDQWDLVSKYSLWSVFPLHLDVDQFLTMVPFKNYQKVFGRLHRFFAVSWSGDQLVCPQRSPLSSSLGTPPSSTAEGTTPFSVCVQCYFSTVINRGQCNQFFRVRTPDSRLQSREFEFAQLS